MLGGAIGVGDKQMISANFGVILTNIGDQAAVWRERNIRIHVLRDDLRRATEDGNAIDEANGLDGIFRAAEVDVVSVGRKSKTVVAAWRGGKNLRVARSGYVAKPDALKAVVGDGADDIFAVGRDGGVDGLAGVGDLRDGKILEGHRSFAAEKREEAVAGDRKNCECDDGADDELAFVFARRLHGNGARSACISRASWRGGGSSVARG